MPSAPRLRIARTACSTVVSRLTSPEHMVGVPGEKSCSTMVISTLTPLEWDVLMKAVATLEFQVCQPESSIITPLALMWMPK